MSIAKCPAGTFGETLVAYLYEECDEVERRRFERHLSTCSACRDELAALSVVREDLKDWKPPAPFAQVTAVPQGDGPAGLTRAMPRFWQRASRPWRLGAYAAAAVLLLATSAAILQLEVDARGDGVTIRTGRLRQLSQQVESAGQAVNAPTSRIGLSAHPAPAVSGPAISHQDLAQLEARLRKESVLPASASNRDKASSEELLQRVRGLIEQSEVRSERRQQQELAVLLAQVVREIEAQRRADLLSIERGLGLIERRTGAEVAQTNELLNYYVRTVSQRPQE